MSDAIVSPSFYADFEGLTSLKKDVKANDPQAIREAARQFESLFTDMMLKSMREAKLGQGLGESDSTDFYQDMYDQQLALQISQGKGLGLADMLVQQLTRSGAIRGAAAAALTGKASTSAAGAGASAQSAAGTASVTTGSATAGTAGTNVAPAPGSATSTGGASHHQRISFIQRLLPYAQRAASQLGVSADNLIAQAALETGWGRHLPSATGGSSNNLFGVKAGSSWSGASAPSPTTEYSEGQPTRQSQLFRAYGSVQQGVDDYVGLLQRQPGYQGALGTGDNVVAFATALQRGGYATDPDYVQKLVDTAAAVRTLRAASASGALVAQNGASVPLGLKPQDAPPITGGGDAT